MDERLQKRELRKKATGEVMTPPWLAQQMLSKIPDSVWADPSKTLLEPSCGDGIFVCLSIKKRLSLGVSIEVAIRNTYAIDIMEDNICECRLNVFVIIRDNMRQSVRSGQQTEKEAYQQTLLLTAILFHNVRVTKDTLSENFDEWKTFDEESELVKRNFMKMAEKSIPVAIKKLEGREAVKQTPENVGQPVRQLDFPETKEIAEKTKRVVRKVLVKPQPQPTKPFVSQEYLFQ